MTFINKLDREGRDPFELLDEIEQTLALDPSPMTWPVGMGGEFHGCFDLRDNRFLTSLSGRGGPYQQAIPCRGPDDLELDRHVPADVLAPFRDNADLARSAYPPFDAAAYRGGQSDAGVLRQRAEGLRSRRTAAGARRDRAAAARPAGRAAERLAGEPKVTGFVFKVQANMDPNHRDRVAFVRVCSGRFRRGMKLRQAHSGKTLAVQNPIFFFAQDRELAEEAWPGDIIGIPNHGTLRVGDSLTEGEDIRFTGIPNFAPEILRRVRLDDPMQAKQLKRALEDLAEEGVTQVFRPMLGAAWIVGVVGQLQLDVLSSRMASEYNVAIGFEAAPYETARWVSSGDPVLLKRFVERHREAMAEDRDGSPVFLPATAGIWTARPKIGPTFASRRRANGVEPATRPRPSFANGTAWGKSSNGAPGPRLR